MRKIILITAVMLFASANLLAQEYRYGDTPFKPVLNNAAYQFNQNLVDVNLQFALPYTSDQDNYAGNLNAHSQFFKNMGVGLKANYLNITDYRSNMQIGASYNYNFFFGKDMGLIVAAGAGVISDIYSDYSYIENDATLNQRGYTDMRPYAEIGVAYRWMDLYIGASALVDFDDNMVAKMYLNAKYDIRISDFAISPLVGYSYYSDYQGTNGLGGIIDAGLMASFENEKWGVEIGGAYASDNFINTYISVKPYTNYIRIFYSAGVPISDETRNLTDNGITNMFGLRFILGPKK